MEIWGGGTQNKTHRHTLIFNNLSLAIVKDESCCAIVCCGNCRGFAHGKGRWRGGKIYLSSQGLSGYRYLVVPQGVCEVQCSDSDL